MSVETLVNKLNSTPEEISFNEVMETIAAHYEYTPTEFTNGQGDDVVTNAAGTNEGSCKLFAFAKQNNLNEEQTLALFGDYYRDDVLKNPQGTDHANIRTFMKYGWAGIEFKQQTLQAK